MKKLLVDTVLAAAVVATECYVKYCGQRWVVCEHPDRLGYWVERVR